MATINLSLDTKSARSQALLNSIGNGATLTLYSGEIPSSPDVLATGQLLASLTLPNPLGVVNEGQLVASPIAQTVALQNGTAGYGRITTSSNVAVCDLDVGVAGSGAAVIINAPLLSSAPVIIAGLTISES